MEKKKLTIEQLRNMRESEDHVEFKRCQQGNLSFNGSDKQKPSDRRKCILGYVVALANANGGYLVLGMEDAFPHKESAQVNVKTLWVSWKMRSTRLCKSR